MSRSIESTLTSYFNEELGINAVGIEDHGKRLFSDGHLDSMDILNLVAFIEASFGIRVNALDISVDNFDRLSSIVSYVEQCKFR